MNSISANLNIMIKASEKASKAIIRDFGEIEKLQVSKNNPTDFVLNTYLKAEKIIIDELRKTKISYSILSKSIDFEKKVHKKNTWIIDPINGIENFLHGIPHFGISIALRSNDEILSGLVFDPIKNELFYAEKNNGAFLNNQRIRVSKKNQINNCLFAIGENLNPNTNILYRKTGSSALDLSYVASGRFDGFYNKNLDLYHIASGRIIAEEAGAVINQIDSQQITRIKILASNPDINHLFLNEINKIES